MTANRTISSGPGGVGAETAVAGIRWVGGYTGRQRATARTDLERAGTNSTFTEHAADDESDIGGALAEAPHEVGEPFTAEWNIDAHPVPLPLQRVLQVAADAVEHLELETRRIDALLRGIGAGRVDHCRIVGGDRRVVSTREQQPHDADERGVHVPLRLEIGRASCRERV